ncbi:MAG: pilus (MSHA type) biogenesis protein MshL [Zoogloeaceae bacterium]|jgi:general secretion pathway protein D|nr:pilus (MSHA type) biogenesis protein MshL [Zoogloeaceae bacterium]
MKILLSSLQRAACFAASVFFLQACSTHRSFEALDPNEPIPVTGLAETVSGESEKLAQQHEALRARLDRAAVVERAARPVAPKYDPLENETISINMHDTGIDWLLWTLANQLGMNLVVDPLVLRQEIRASLALKNVTTRELYNHILETFDLRGEIRNGALRIDLYEERIFSAGFLNTNLSINLASGGDVFGSNVSAGDSVSGSANTLRADFGISGNTPRQIDTYEELENAVKNILGLAEGRLPTQPSARNPSVTGAEQGGVAAEPSPVRYSLNRTSGALYVKARPSQIRAIQQIIDLNKTILRRQLLVEAQLIDVQLNDGHQFGVDWTLLRRNVAGVYGADSLRVQEHSSSFPDGTLLDRTLTIPAQAIGGALAGNSLGLSYGDERFSATIKALSSFGTLRVLSNPSVRVRNGTPALLSVGANIRYITKSSSTFNNIGGGSATTTSDVETDALFSGVVVGVVPYIHDNGRIELLIHPVQTEVTPESLSLIDVGNGNVVTLPRINYKGLTTTLNLGDGDMVMIGGLIDQNQSNNKDGLPGLSNIPAVGNLFGEQSKSHQSRELVIVLRVRLL